MKHRFVLITIAILCVFVCILSKSMFSITEDDELLYANYQRQSFVSRIPTVSSVISSVTMYNSNDTETDDSHVNMPGISNLESWTDVLESVHRSWGQHGFYYDQNPHDYNKVKVWTDCSGYIGYCLYLYGRVPDKLPDRLTPHHPIHSCTGWDSDNSCGHYMSADEFGALCYIPGSNFDITTDLKLGDILWYDGHVEAFHSYGSNATRPVVYNWGSNKSAEDRYKNCKNPEDYMAVQCWGTGGRNLDTVKAVWRLK